MGENDKPISGSGVHDDMIKQVHDKVSKGAAKLEKERDTGGKGKGKGGKK